jgi:hypothetical protein
MKSSSRRELEKEAHEEQLEKGAREEELEDLKTSRSQRQQARDGPEPDSLVTLKSSGRSPCPNDEHVTSDICRICQRQLMGAAMKVTEVWLGI